MGRHTRGWLIAAGIGTLVGVGFLQAPRTDPRPLPEGPEVVALGVPASLPTPEPVAPRAEPWAPPVTSPTQVRRPLQGERILAPVPLDLQAPDLGTESWNDVDWDAVDWDAEVWIDPAWDETLP